MRWIFLLAFLAGCPPEAEEPRPRASYFVHADVGFHNAMGSGFQLRGVTMWIDGQPFATRVDENDELAKQVDIPLGPATLQGGEHDVRVEAEYQGNGYGVFSYLKKYRFRARLAYRLDLPDARPRRITCTGYESGGPTTPLEERPKIRCEATASP